MKRKLLILAMLLATAFFWMPSGTDVAAQDRQNNARKPDKVMMNTGQPGKRSGVWRKKNAHGYRNYGQYRRTQVGNRRSRMVNRSYWNDGVRLTRRVRVYY